MASVLLLAACAEEPPTINLPPVAEMPSRDSAFGGASYPIGVVGNRPTRTVLANDTALAGENFLLRLPEGGPFDGGSVSGILSAAGPLPPPFEFAIARDFVPLNGGALSYIARTPAPGVTCVLAAGRAGSAFGPSGRILMRNCVRGSVEQALAPVAPSSTF